MASSTKGGGAAPLKITSKATSQSANAAKTPTPSPSPGVKPVNIPNVSEGRRIVNETNKKIYDLRRPEEQKRTQVEVKKAELRKQFKASDEENRGRARDNKQQALSKIIATEAKKDQAKTSQYGGITRNTGSATGGRTDGGTKKPGKPFRFTGNDPAPQFPNVPDRGTGGGGGGGGDPDPGPTPITTFADIPNVSSTMSNPVPSQTLMPGRDVVNFTEVASSPEAMQQILFEELSSFELVNMTRGDTVEGLNPYYSVISNLSSLRRQYNPSQIISLQTPIQNKFDIYQISLIDKIPEKEEFFFIDENGDFVIEFENIENDEVIEIQIATSGKII